MVKLATFEQFGPTPNVLALPPHIPDDEPQRKMIISLRELHEIEHKDILETANRIRSILDTGSYLKVRHVKSNMYLITMNEPIILFGASKGQKITISHYSDVQVDEDSIIIYMCNYSII